MKIEQISKYSVILILTSLIIYPLNPEKTQAFSLFGLEIEESIVNAQNEEYHHEEETLSDLKLIEPARNTDPNPYKEENTLELVEGKAIVSQSGPGGTIIELEEREENNGQITLYTVKSGDSIPKIAKIFGVSGNTIRWANDLGLKDPIVVGQNIIILPISGIRYKVKKGDTIDSIAKRYKADSSDILSYNGLSKEDAIPSVGEEILIPDGEMQIVDSTKPAKTRYKKGKVFHTKLRGTGGPFYPGYYAFPVSGGRVTQGLHGYNSIDIGGGDGIIRASAAGTVIIAKNSGYNGGYGNYVVIRHDNGTQTLYAHNKRVTVSTGQYVSRMQPIALLGSTGNSTGPHVHFEIRGAQNPFD